MPFCRKPWKHIGLSGFNSGVVFFSSGLNSGVVFISSGLNSGVVLFRVILIVAQLAFINL